MDARWIRLAFAAAAWISVAATFRTPNFTVTAPTAEFAQEMGQVAEQYRQQLAVLWLGEKLPNWSRPCPVKVSVGPHLGAGGATSFVFHGGEVYDWRMNIQGSRERLLDSVLPHEVTHTIFASHFRRPLPRWADEGACTTVEHQSERQKQQAMLIDFLRTGRGIPFSSMFAMKEYPADILPLYAQGYSLARYLIDQRGRRQFIRFVEEGLESEDWVTATQEHYGYPSLAALQDQWLTWVRQGSPLRSPRDEPALATEEIQVAAATPVPSATPGRFRQLAPQPAPNELIYRGQNRSLWAETLGRLVPIRRLSGESGASPAAADPFLQAGRGMNPRDATATGRDAVASGLAAWPATITQGVIPQDDAFASQPRSRVDVHAGGAHGPSVPAETESPGLPTEYAAWGGGGRGTGPPSVPTANSVRVTPEPVSGTRGVAMPTHNGRRSAPGPGPRHILIEWSREEAARQGALRPASESWSEEASVHFDAPLEAMGSMRR